MSNRFEALRACWHPIAYSHEVGSSPRATTLLGERLVAWRDAGGHVRVLEDRCVHRGTALSLGRVEGDEIVCPYHGWRYGADGACTYIPQLEDPTRVPGKARVAVVRAEEHLGLVWAALEPPRFARPSVPEFDDARWKVVRAGPFAWNCEASRQLENFTDFGHFAFVHPGLLGDPAKAVVAPYEVEVEGHVVWYAYGRPDQPNTPEYPVFASGHRNDELRRTRYAIHLPYTIVEHIDWGGADGIVYVFASQPVDAEHCVGYCMVARNYNPDQPDEVMQAFEQTIFEQDRRIVESQQPRHVPLDPHDEMHLKFDAAALAYRRAMAENGFG